MKSRKMIAENPHVRFDEGEVASCTAAIETEGRNSPSIAQGLPSLRRVHCRRQPEAMTRPQVASRSEVARGLRASGCAATPRRGSLLYKTQTSTKRTAHRLAAALAIATALCATATLPSFAIDYRIGNGTDQTVDLTSNIDTGTGFYALGWGGATGIVNVDSCDLIVGGNLIVGHAANSRGELYLNSGTINANSLNNTRTIIANNQNTTGIVVVNGGTLTTGRELSVGESGTGTLTINGGSVVSTNAVYIGKNTNGNGTVNVNGGSFEARNTLTVGNSGTGAMTIGDGGTVTVTGKLTVGTSSGRGTLTVDGGILTFNGYNNSTQSTVDNGMFTIEKGSVTLDGNGHLDLGTNENSPGTMTVKSGGSYTGTGNNLGLIVGWKSLGTLNIEGGTVTLRNLTFCIDSGAVGSEVNITDGGVLQANQIKGYDASSSAKLIIDGGTFKAREDDTPFSTHCSGLNIYAGDDGAVFDSNGRNITIDKEIEDKSGEAGKVRFSGGGSITLGGANTYTGGTTIELGTKVVASDATAKATILSNLAVDGSTKLADENGIVLFEYSGLTDEDLATAEAAVTYPNCGDGTDIYRDGDTIKVNFVAPAWELDADHLTWSSLVTKYGTHATDATVLVRAASNCTLTIDQDATVGELVSTGSGSVTLAVNSGCTLAKTGSGTALWSLDNASAGTISVNAGTLKVKSVTGTGTDQTIVVKSGATFDMNGNAVRTASVRLEEGATLKNDRANIRNDKHQTTNLILDGDATVNAVKFFGLCGSSDSAATTLNIGEHTLTVEGSGFWLVNTTIDGSGEIVANGVLSVPMGSSSGADCTLTIASGGTLHGNGTLSVKNFTNNGIINNTDMLTVTGTLTPANAIPKLTLASGATVKATGTAQTVSTTFSASGTITVDASEITKAQLDAGDVPVLTVPATFNHSGVTWNVTGAAIEGARAKWRTDEGGVTKTLYVGKSTGLMLIFM